MVAIFNENTRKQTTQPKIQETHNLYAIFYYKPTFPLWSGRNHLEESGAHYDLQRTSL